MEIKAFSSVTVQTGHHVPAAHRQSGIASCRIFRTTSGKVCTIQCHPHLHCARIKETGICQLRPLMPKKNITQTNKQKRGSCTARAKHPAAEADYIPGAPELHRDIHITSWTGKRRLGHNRCCHCVRGRIRTAAAMSPLSRH